MAENLTMVGVAKAMLLNIDTGDLIGDGIIDTLDNSSIEFSTSSTEIRGGTRNKLIDIYYHTPTGSVTISNVVFNLGFIAANLGANAPAFGTNVFKTESVTLSGTTGTVSQTPQLLNSDDANAVGWVCYQGTTSKVNFTGNTFTATGGIPEGATVLVTYYQNDSNAEYIEIPASIIPQRVRVVLTAALSSNKSSDGITGYAQWDIGVLQLSGSQTINMTPDGYATTELTGMMLENNAFGCVAIANEIGGGTYAKATVMLNNTNWYDDVVALGIEGGDYTAAANTTQTLAVYAVRSNGSSFLADNSLLTFTAVGDTDITVGANSGVVTIASSATGSDTSTITVKITAAGAPAVEAHCVVTVS